MKLLIVVSGFLPAKNYGGPVVSMTNFIKLLGKDIKCYIVTRNKEFGTEKKLENIKKGWNKVLNSNVTYLDDNNLTYKSFNNIIEEIKPNLIYINSIFSYKMLIPILKISKSKNIPILLAPRGELCKNAFNMNFFKKIKKKIYLPFYKFKARKCNIFYQSTSEEETNSIIQLLGVKRNKIFELSNIPTISSVEVVNRKKEKGFLNAVFISRIHPKKNLHFLIECLSEVKGTVKLDIYGPKEDKEYWKKIEDIIKKLSDNIHVKYCKNLDHEEIISTMSKYDCFLFYTLSENYGHVIAEAINALCVPVLSNTTPWNDLKETNSGFISNLENKIECIDNIQKIIDMNQNEYDKYIDNLKKYRKKKFNVDGIKQDYYDMIKKIIMN